MVNFLKAESCKLKTVAGFTLIEMIVVISIFTIMTGVVLANLPQFRERTALQLVAQKISLTIREDQVYGVAFKSSSTTIFPSHGIYFYPTTGGSSNLKSYILFADNPTSNNKYDGVAEKVTQYDLTGSVEIQKIETFNTVDLTHSEGFHLVFKRPKTEANFTDSLGSTITASYAKITLVSTRSLETRTVWVWNTGQISVKSS